MKDFIAFIADTWVVWVIGGALGLLTGWAVIHDSNNRDRLMQQCMADGKKEYECVSLLKQDTVPVFIPIYGGR